MGAFVVVNTDGWVLTAKHIIDPYSSLKALKDKYDAHVKIRDSIANDPDLTPEEKYKKLKKVGARNPPSDSVTDFAFWWGDDQCRFREAHVIEEVDLALCKLDNFNPASVPNYPTFKDPSSGIDPGTFLCRLGFPFAEVRQSYTAAQPGQPVGTFTIDPSGLALFPNEGMFTRTITRSTNPLVGYIETSTPGLKGQSGGPIFDKNGTVWAIQNRTGHLALGFSPPVPNGKTGEVEHQFLNVGRGAHPETVVSLMKSKDLDFKVSTY
jgi:hypothetical protein